MAKKRGIKIIARIVEAIVVILIAGLLVLHLPAVQNFLAHKITDKLTGPLGENISFSSVRFVPFRTLVMEDVGVIENFESGPDTLLYAKKLSATFSLKGLLNVRDDRTGGVFIDRLKTIGLVFNMILFDEDPNGYTFNLNRAFGIPEDKYKEPQDSPDLFTIGRAELIDSKVRMVNRCADAPKYLGYGINWSDMDLFVPTAHVRNLRYGGGRIAMDINDVTATDKCGYTLRGTGQMSTGYNGAGGRLGLTEVTNAHLWDAGSDLYIPYYAMKYDRLLDFSDYLNKVDMSIRLRRSRLALKTVAAFSGVFGDSPVVFDIRRGSADGPVNDLHVDGLDLTDLYSGTAADLDFVMTNLVLSDKEPDVAAEVRYLDFTSRSLTDLLGAILPEAEVDLSSFAKNVKARFSGSASGWIDHLRTDGLFETNYGNILVNANTQKIDSLPGHKGAFSFDGKLALDNTDLGEFMNMPSLGPTSMTITAAGDFVGEVTRARVDTFRIDHIRFLDYTYQGIRGKGTFDDGVFDANVISTDPNANIIFGGRVSTKHNADGLYYASGNLRLANLDLEKTGLDTRGGGSAVRGSISANAALDTLGNIFGHIEGQDFRYITDEKSNQIGNFSLSFNDISDRGTSRNLNHIMTLNGQRFGRVSYRSAIPVTKFPEFVRDVVLARYLPSLAESEGEAHSFNIDVNLDDTQALLSPLKQDIYINSGTKLRLAMSPSGNLEASFNSGSLRFGDVKVKDIELKGGESSGSFKLRTVTPATVSLPGMDIKNIELSSNLLRDSLSLSASATSTRIEEARLALGAAFYRDESDSLAIRAKVGDSHIVFDGDRWTFRKGGIDYHTTGNLYVNGIGLYLGDQTLSIEGGMSSKEPAEMTLTLDRFDLSVINGFLGENAPFQINGLLNGNAFYSTPLESNAGLEVALDCPDLKLNGQGIGRIKLEGGMDDEYDNRVNFKASHISPSGIEDLRIRGDESHFDLNSGNLKATMLLLGFDPAILQPAAEEFVRFGKGSLDGKVCVDYTVGSDKIDLSRSYLTLKDTLTVLPTGVKYALDGDIRGERDGINIREINIRDFSRGSARLSGNLSEIKARLNSLQLFSESGQTDMVRGRLFASGDVGFLADEDGVMKLNADLATARDGELRFSLAGMVKEESSTLTFVPAPSEEEEEEEEPQRPAPERKSSPLVANVSVRTTPTVRLSAEIDNNGGNVATVAGTGLVTARYDSRSGDVTLGGDYNINEGRFKLSAAGVFSKEFDISDESSVRFAGDIMDTELNISASSTVKASLATLVADTTSVSKLRDVICSITVSDRLRNPKLSFDVEVPDLSPETQMIVESELNTEDKRQKQFLALMATNNFVPGGQSGINNQLGSGFILSNLTAIASGQISSLLQRAGIPVDLGVGYIQNETGNDVVDVNLSTRMFNNRVLVNGSVGNRQYSVTSEDNIVGDIDIEIKLDRSGQLRAKLFSHSADDFTNFLDNSQRSGAGLSYQKEFNNLKDLFRSIFRSKSQDELPAETPRKTLVIE